MNKYLILLTIFFVTISCKNDTNNNAQNVDSNEVTYASFGNKIDIDGAISTSEMAEKYSRLTIGDTITTKLAASIKEVCSKKGCWMKLDLGTDKEIMVRFKDYGFFIPLNAEGDVIVNGKAYITEVSVEDLRHYAEDAGKNDEKIMAITESEKSFAFEADGVLLKQ